MINQHPAGVGELEAALVKTYDNVMTLTNVLEEATEILTRLGEFDTLTGLPNRNWFYDQLGLLTAMARREKRELPVLLVDLNCFREINDTLGHAVGDLVLSEIAQRIMGVLRDSDVAARLGDDEFGVLLPTTYSMEGALTVAQKIVEAIEKPLSLEGHNAVVGVSVGVALFPEHGETQQALLRQADLAMCEAKRCGGGFAASNPDRADSGRHRSILAGDVRDAIKRKELVLHYQPKIDVDTNELIGAEALVRWQHPEFGLIPPDEFIPVVERTSFIKELTISVMDTALAWVSQQRDAGQKLSVSVNLSARSLHDADLPADVSDLLERHQTPPEGLILEITESAILIDAEKAMDVVNRLFELGVGISIDDFGTGYSSLAYLRHLPVSEVKIDKSFVLNICTSNDDVAIVRSVIDLSKNLGMKVVAEGVESSAAWSLLGYMGCDTAQGYYISPPVPETGFQSWMAGVKRAA